MDGFVAFYIFILAAITGYELIAKTPVTFHLPLLSGATIIQGIILVGAMLAMGHAETTAQTVIGFIAVALAATNVVGGYMITSKAQGLFNKAEDDDYLGDL